ncbi:hypothetical protein IAT40_002529 [Kwoniella sp. CBS 6097]
MPWLMKAEPDSRIVKGKDVKFSVDDFEKIGVSPWDGVRNHEAKKIMKEKMKLGDKVLFYHSNCKTPGVFALAEIAKEGYPDYTAWDPEHPYFDAKTKQDNPTWFMVNVKFIGRLAHPPTLALIKVLAALPPSALPDEISYIGKDGLKAIAGMQLVNRGRLSVQPVEEAAYEAIVLLGTKGGFESLLTSSNSSSTSKKTPEKAETILQSKTTKNKSEMTTSQTSASSALASNKAAKALPPDSVSGAIARENTIHPGKGKKKVDKGSDSDLSPPPLLDEVDISGGEVTSKKRKDARNPRIAGTTTEEQISDEPMKTNGAGKIEIGREGERRSKRIKK